ncbi:hypothetical protein [Paenisporosarcina sp. TG-14]|uniref:hypothetical protein n=1 Tax=Paenisporosarcina sp. TG-14 TaxID=1231057 RepID=UPI000311ADEE|nr:hypothetical protein [Paenisporosarcina sp. TG-14]
MKVYSKNVQLVEDTLHKIEFIILENENVFIIDLNLVNIEKPLNIGQYQTVDQVLLKKEMIDYNILVYTKFGDILVTRVNHIPNVKFQKTETSYELNFENFSDLLSFKQTGETTFSVFNFKEQYLFSIHDSVSHDLLTDIYPVDLELTTIEYRYLTIGKIYYSTYNEFIIYDLFRKELFTKKVILINELPIIDLEFNLTSPSSLEISFEDERASINFKKISGKGTKIFNVAQLKKHREKHILGKFNINGSKYYLHNKQNGIFLTRSNPTKISGFYPNMKLRFFGKNLYIFGRNTHYAYKASGRYEYLYIGDSDKPISKFVRLFKLPLLRRYGFFKVPIASLYVNNRIHNNFYLGSKMNVLHNLKLKLRPRKAKTLDLTIYDDQVNIIRTNLRGRSHFHYYF